VSARPRQAIHSPYGRRRIAGDLRRSVPRPPCGRRAAETTSRRGAHRRGGRGTRALAAPLGLAQGRCDRRFCGGHLRARVHARRLDLRAVEEGVARAGRLRRRLQARLGRELLVPAPGRAPLRPVGRGERPSLAVALKREHEALRGDRVVQETLEEYGDGRRLRSFAGRLGVDARSRRLASIEAQELACEQHRRSLPRLVDVGCVRVEVVDKRAGVRSHRRWIPRYLVVAAAAGEEHRSRKCEGANTDHAGVCTRAV
jgi:hypothetical protein